MAIQSNFPSLKPTLLLDFANTKQLDPRITFTRASTATFYDGVTTAMAEQNLLLQSQAFEDASWTKSQTAVSGTNTIVAPDGTTTAEEVRDGTATNIHSVFQGLTLASGTTYVASVFLKNVDRQYAILAVSGGVSAYASAKFDLTGGTSTANQAAGSGWSVTSVAMTSVGSGWYRCVLVFVSGTSGSCNVRVGLASDGTTFTTNGSGLESYTGTDLKIAVWGAQFEQRSSVTAYTATTTQPITNYIPALRTAAAGVARFEHNPVTGESLGLEIEEQRTNLLVRSQELDNASWTKTRSSVTANIIVAPDGTLTGDKLVEDTTASNNHYAYVLGTISATTTYTWTVYAKAGERTWLGMSAYDGSTRLTFFNLSSGTVGTNASGNTASITAVGNGWYRCTITRTSGAGTTAALEVYLASADNTISYTGDGYSGLYLWGAQLEAGAFATSYIPTTTATVTRAADAATMTGTNFSSWYRADEGTLFFNGSTYSTSSPTMLTVSNGTATGEILQLNQTSGGAVRFEVRSGGTSQASITTSVTAVANTAFFTAAAYKVNDFAAASNSGTVGTDTSGTTPVPDSLRLMQSGSGGTIFNGTIRKIAYYPLRVTNAQLQAMTTV